MKTQLFAFLILFLNIVNVNAQIVKYQAQHNSITYLPKDIYGEYGRFTLSNSQNTSLLFYGFKFHYKGSIGNMYLESMQCTTETGSLSNSYVDTLSQTILFFQNDLIPIELSPEGSIDFTIYGDISKVTKQDTFQLFFDRIIAEVGDIPVEITDIQGNQLVQSNSALDTIIISPGYIRITRDLDKRVGGFVSYVSPGQKNVLGFEFKIKTDQPFSTDGIIIPIQVEGSPEVFENIKICFGYTCLNAEFGPFSDYNSNLIWNHPFTVEDSIEGLILYDISSSADPSNTDEIRLRLSQDMLIAPRYQNADSIPFEQIIGDFVWSHWIRIKSVTSVVTDNQVTSDYQLFPNPVSNIIYSSIPLGTSYSAINSVGLVVEEDKWKGMINVSSWIPGEYIIRFKLSDSVITERIIKN